MMTPMMNFQHSKILSEISLNSTVDYNLNQDENAIISVNMVDICSINWKEGMREIGTSCVIEDDDETENKLKPMMILILNGQSREYAQVKLRHLLQMILSEQLQ